ncbi:hypothetical protein JR316_0013339 [Psilocybe cubensis]|uniref:DUF6533 domain-containing protein n=2 Tax=Psilocybe cubensis TaxID=181762 RepID=A0A8H8CH10_PSICU|nr:hypothetical protein JR316_0013339 [Psilocybe cubensis]KAH9474871.1 hypothetical protein JR316_0013339 [Psilocybe cubensis]
MHPMTNPVSLASVAALAAQFWDTMICFGDEVEYLWRGRFRFVKLIYFCSRYLLLLGQIANEVLLLLFHTQGDTPNQNICPGMFIFKSSLTQVGLVLLEIVLFLRVYALYHHIAQAKWFLFVAFLVSFTLEICGTALFIQSMSTMSGCGLLRADDKSVYFFGTGVGLAQIVLVVATLLELASKQRQRRVRSPLTNMVLQQGVASCFLVLTLIAVLMVYNFFSYLDESMGEAMISWYYTLISVGTSRLILEMWKLPSSENSEHNFARDSETGNLHLTTLSDSNYRNGNTTAWMTALTSTTSHYMAAPSLYRSVNSPSTSCDISDK